MTVGELKKILNEYDDSQNISIELHENVSIETHDCFVSEDVELSSEDLFIVEGDKKEICIMNDWAFKDYNKNK